VQHSTQQWTNHLVTAKLD